MVNILISLGIMFTLGPNPLGITIAGVIFVGLFFIEVIVAYSFSKSKPKVIEPEYRICPRCNIKVEIEPGICTKCGEKL